MTTRAPSSRSDGKITRPVLFTPEQYEPIEKILGGEKFAPFARTVVMALTSAIEDYAAARSKGDPRIHSYHVEVARAALKAGAFTVDFDAEGGAA
ncbi:hypothetical protein [Kocuria rosea]|uniref:hypothetical protein n=1 Tax=Kocuria rosea TaxID=1275 RepID=UPI0011A21BD1|nr:hypothetical protein [Kocuria rosea]